MKPRLSSWSCFPRRLQPAVSLGQEAGLLGSGGSQRVTGKMISSRLCSYPPPALLCPCHRGRCSLAAGSSWLLLRWQWWPGDGFGTLGCPRRVPRPHRAVGGLLRTRAGSGLPLQLWEGEQVWPEPFGWLNPAVSSDEEDTWLKRESP